MIYEIKGEAIHNTKKRSNLLWSHHRNSLFQGHVFLCHCWIL